jgi:quaternary ammonium compound-resistance protein SugE
MAWIYLLVAGIFEIGFALGLKYSDSFSRPWSTAGTLVAGALSFYLLSVAMKSFLTGTAYTVWTGIGSVRWSWAFFSSRSPAASSG